jgi:hypothetical protein
MPAITLPCGSTGTVFESQKSSKLAYLTGMRMTCVSIASSPAISQKPCIASSRDAAGLGRTGSVEPNDSIAVYIGVVGDPPFRISHMCKWQPNRRGVRRALTDIVASRYDAASRSPRCARHDRGARDRRPTCCRRCFAGLPGAASAASKTAGPTRAQLHPLALSERRIRAMAVRHREQGSRD